MPFNHNNYCCGFVLAIPLIPTFDPQNMRIMGHALRIIGTFQTLGIIGEFWEFENSILLTKKIRTIYLAQLITVILSHL